MIVPTAVAQRFAEALVAAAENIPSDPVAALTGAGVAGVVLGLVLFGKLVTGRELDRAIAERDLARAELVALRTKFDNEVIPALTRLADAAAERGKR